MKNKFLQIAALLLVSVLLIATLASCSGGNQSSDQSGSYGDVSWTYTSSSKTLSIRGTGVIPNAEGDDPQKVSWAAIRSSVERVVIADGVTSIGAYAFYGMGALKEITVPEGVTSIGKCAFAFCFSLEDIDIPTSVENVGVSAFEACTALESIKLPTALKTLGERAFAFCGNLKIALIAGAPESIGKWTFKGCDNLQTLAIAKGEAEMTIDPDAFEDAGDMNADKISEYAESVIITVYYKDLSGGADPREPLVETKAFGETYSYLAPAIDGYTVEGEGQKTGTVESKDIDLIFNYTKSAETAEPAPQEPEEPTEPEEEKSPLGMIVAIAILVIVIAGIIVGAVLLIRSDKKTKKNGTTVRKNNNGDGKNGKGKNK